MTITPPFLKSNDTVAIVAPAGNFKKGKIEIAVSALQGFGLNVIQGNNLYNNSGVFSAGDARRTEDLQWAIDFPSVKAIFCARGGYGTSRIIDQLDFARFSESPKWIIGFSDITVLHAHLFSLGFQTLHAMMPVQFGNLLMSKSLNSLKETLFGLKPTYSVVPHKKNRIGQARGHLVGGNLSILCHLIGTQSMPDLNKNILFIEDVGEYSYNLDRMMVQLKRSGILNDLAGMIIGEFSQIKEGANPFGQTPDQIIQHQIEEYDFPVSYGFPVGHEESNFALIHGAEVDLRVTPTGSELTFK